VLDIKECGFSILPLKHNGKNLEFVKFVMERGTEFPFVWMDQYVTNLKLKGPICYKPQI